VGNKKLVMYSQTFLNVQVYCGSYVLSTQYYTEIEDIVKCVIMSSIIFIQLYVQNLYSHYN